MSEDDPEVLLMLLALAVGLYLLVYHLEDPPPAESPASSGCQTRLHPAPRTISANSRRSGLIMAGHVSLSRGAIE